MKFLNELIEALEQHKPYNYSDDNTTVKVTPNNVYISYNNYKPVDKRQEFLDFCDSLDDELFTTVCDSFEPGELKKLQNQIDDVYQSIFDNNATVEIKESLLNKSLLAIDIKCDVFQEKRESTIKQLTNKKMSETIITEFTKEQFFDEDTPEESELFEIALYHSCNKHLQRDFSNNLSTYAIQTFFEVNIYKDQHTNAKNCNAIIPIL
jgi:hypothetical protein